MSLHPGPLPPPSTCPTVPGGGAVLVFDGVVRPTEGGTPIAGLAYQVYEPMTGRELQNLATSIVNRFGLLALHAVHSVGEVPNHGTSFRLRVVAAHRREAIDAADTFIVEMKRVVPIWKLPIRAHPPTHAGS